MPGIANITSPFPEDQVLYLTTRQAFTAQHAAGLLALCARAPVDWAAVVDLAIQHHVAPLVYHNLEKTSILALNIPSGILAVLKRAQIDNILLKKDARMALEQAVRLFNQYGIEIMLVKGAALNLLVYAQPWYTLSWDIDLVTRLRREALDPQVLQAIESQFLFRNQANQRYITKIEYDFYSHHDVTMNDLLPIPTERIWCDSSTLQVSNGQVRIMAPEDILITAAISALRKRYFRLKNLCDLAEIVHHYPDLDWELAADKARAYQCRAIVYAAMQVTRYTLTVPMPLHFLSDLQVNPLQAATINRLARFAIGKVGLKKLSSLSQRTFLDRQLSWSLALTYASYRPDQAIHVICNLFKTAFTLPNQQMNLSFYYEQE